MVGAEVRELWICSCGARVRRLWMWISRMLVGWWRGVVDRNLEVGVVFKRVLFEVRDLIMAVWER